MKVLITILPVFFMIGLGVFSDFRQWITEKQLEGANVIVSKILFPVMVFNAIFTTTFKASSLMLILFVFVAHCIAIGIGFLFAKYLGKDYSHFSPYLMCSVDGGNVCFPLYATIVGASYIGNIVLLDIACIFCIFLVIPVLVSLKRIEGSNYLILVTKIMKSPFIITLILGAVLNQLGLYTWIQNTEILDIYTQIVSMITAPIVPLILFSIGYQFKLEKESIFPLFKCMVLRIVIMIIIELLIFLLFSSLVSDHAMMIAILLYFMCPPALVLSNQIEPLYTKKSDANFTSTFISLYMIFTLIVYVCIVVFFA